MRNYLKKKIFYASGICFIYLASHNMWILHDCGLTIKSGQNSTMKLIAEPKAS